MYELGKRMTCANCGSQCLVIAATDVGVLTCCGQPMELDEAKKLPSSD
jgi:transcription elongation factor Elf1